MKVKRTFIDSSNPLLIYQAGDMFPGEGVTVTRDHIDDLVKAGYLEAVKEEPEQTAVKEPEKTVVKKPVTRTTKKR